VNWLRTLPVLAGRRHEATQRDDVIWRSAPIDIAEPARRQHASHGDVGRYGSPLCDSHRRSSRNHSKLDIHEGVVRASAALSVRKVALRASIAACPARTHRSALGVSVGCMLWEQQSGLRRPGRARKRAAQRSGLIARAGTVDSWC